PIVGPDLLRVEGRAFTFLPCLVAGDEFLDRRRKAARHDIAWMLDRTVPAAPQAGAVHVDDEAGIRVAGEQPVGGPRIALELPRGRRRAAELRSLAGGRVEIRLGLVTQPA